MDELDKNLPDDFWRRAFDDAAETPPPRVWATIEQRLDESNGPKVLPLWGTGLASSRPLIWVAGLAASVALFLVGWWIIGDKSVTQPVARMQQHTQTESTTDVKSPDNSLATRTTLPASKQAGTLAADKPLTGSIRPLGRTVSPSTSVVTNRAMLAQATNKPVGRVDPIAKMDFTSALNALQEQALTENHSARRMAATASYAANENTSAVNSAHTQPAFVAFEKLAGKPFRMRRPGMIQRIVWVRPAMLAVEPELTKSRHQTREMWASVSMMPGAFNPSVSVRPAQASFTNSALALSAGSNSQPAVNSRSNFSVAYQAGAGVQLTERWSVESGIGYLSGHSTVETPGQRISAQMDVLANRNSGNTNVYVDALRNSSQGPKLANSAPQANYNNLAANAPSVASMYDNRELQTISNNYEYVQVPVQLGYQLRPRKKLSMAVLGGLLTNIFVRNTVGNAVVVTNKDDVYRPVALAATMGARLRYRPTRQWSASVAGVYQPSLESGTKTDSQVQSRPTSTGMSFGLDYHF